MPVTRCIDLFDANGDAINGRAFDDAGQVNAEMRHGKGSQPRIDIEYCLPKRINESNYAFDDWPGNWLNLA